MPDKQSNPKAFTAMRGKPVYSSDGKKVGEVENIYYDRVTRQPEWVEVKKGVLGGLIGGKRTLVPVVEAEMQEDGTGSTFIRVPYSKDQIDEVPGIDADQEISEEEKYRLHSHYGLQLPPEDEMRLGKREKGRGKARVRKLAETEPTTEEADVGDAETEITLPEEKRVISKKITRSEEITVRPEEEERR